MVENGLLAEIAELRGIAMEVYGREDHTEGIFQSIGTFCFWKELMQRVQGIFKSRLEPKRSID